MAHGSSSHFLFLLFFQSWRTSEIKSRKGPLAKMGILISEWNYGEQENYCSSWVPFLYGSTFARWWKRNLFAFIKYIIACNNQLGNDRFNNLTKYISRKTRKYSILNPNRILLFWAKKVAFSRRQKENEDYNNII